MELLSHWSARPLEPLTNKTVKGVLMLDVDKQTRRHFTSSAVTRWRLLPSTGADVHTAPPELQQGAAVAVEVFQHYLAKSRNWFPCRWAWLHGRWHRCCERVRQEVTHLTSVSLLPPCKRCSLQVGRNRPGRPERGRRAPHFLWGPQPPNSSWC